jgi:uncharacterized repeat protein (TIGR03803 family)
MHQSQKENMKQRNGSQEWRSACSKFLACAALLAGCLALAVLLQAQTYSVLHNFNGPTDGSQPTAGLTMDAAGNFYGTTERGGDASCDCGTVFKLTHKNGTWVHTLLYTFKNGRDGSEPRARVVFGPDGALYGTTSSGGAGPLCCGTVFRLTPRATACPTTSCPWVLTSLHIFSGGNDGASPGYGDLVFDQDGAIYGTTYNGGSGGICSGDCGVVFQLAYSGGVWHDTTLYSFTGQSDGGLPFGGVIFDGSGNLLGTTSTGGYYDPPDLPGAGVIFKLTPASPQWTESTLYMFQASGDGGLPYAAPTLDAAGNMYGTTAGGGAGGGVCGGLYGGCGAVYQGAGQTAFGIFPNDYPGQPIVSGPMAPITVGADGNLYGTTYADGDNGAGNIFKLTHSLGAWHYTSLHDFTGGNDGGFAVSNVVMDSQGHLYGTSAFGGPTADRCNLNGVQKGCGVIWEITP